MTRLEYLEARIDQLEAAVSRLAGSEFHRREITMAEYIQANMRGDKVTEQRYLDQYKRNGQGAPGRGSAPRKSRIVGRPVLPHDAAPPHDFRGGQ